MKWLVLALIVVIVLMFLAVKLSAYTPGPGADLVDDPVYHYTGNGLYVQDGTTPGGKTIFGTSQLFKWFGKLFG